MNLTEINKVTGLKFESEQDLIWYVSNELYYLATHNKNYTKEQERRIDNLKDIFEVI